MYNIINNDEHGFFKLFDHNENKIRAYVNDEATVFVCLDDIFKVANIKKKETVIKKLKEEHLGKLYVTSSDDYTKLEEQLFLSDLGMFLVFGQASKKVYRELFLWYLNEIKFPMEMEMREKINDLPFSKWLSLIFQQFNNRISKLEKEIKILKKEVNENE